MEEQPWHSRRLATLLQQQIHVHSKFTSLGSDNRARASISKRLGHSLQDVVCMSKTENARENQKSRRCEVQLSVAKGDCPLP